MQSLPPHASGWGRVEVTYVAGGPFKSVGFSASIEESWIVRRRAARDNSAWFTPAHPLGRAQCHGDKGPFPQRLS